MKIQKELDEVGTTAGRLPRKVSTDKLLQTKITLHKTIESVLQRGEKIDDLVQKSDGLSAQSKMFYREFMRLLSTRKRIC